MQGSLVLNRLRFLLLLLPGLLAAVPVQSQQPPTAAPPGASTAAPLAASAPAEPIRLIRGIDVIEPAGADGALISVHVDDSVLLRTEIKLRVEGDIEMLLEVGGMADYREETILQPEDSPIEKITIERAVNNFYKIYLFVPDDYPAKKYDGTQIHIVANASARRAWQRKVAREKIELAEQATAGQMDEIKRFMEQGEKAMAEERYNDASRLYWLVLRYPESEYHPRALERYGFSHYRAGRLAPAVTEYERYLAKYPNGEDVEKVSQLLAVIKTAREEQMQELKKRRADREKQRTAWRVSGSLTSNYREDHINSESSSGDSRSDITGQNINTYAYFGATKPLGDKVADIRFSGSHREAMLADQENDDRISRLHASLSSMRRDWIVSAGKQSQSILGPVGDFFGVYGEYKPTESSSVAAGWGKRPDREELFEEDNNREFVAVSGQLDDVYDYWNVRGYYMEDYYGDLTNRKLLGMQVNGIDPEFRRSIYFSTDYDFLFQEWNSLVLRPSFDFYEDTNVQLTLWKRKTVPFQILNVLRGQRFGDIEELQNITGLTESELIDVASELDSENERIAVRVNQPILENVRLSAYVSYDEWENVEAIQAILDENGDPFFEGAGMEEVPGREVMSYSANLSVSGDRLYHSYGVNYSEGDDSERTSLSASLRWRITEQWRFDPSFRYNLTERTDGTQTRDSYGLLLRGEYAATRKLKFRVETGIVRTETETTNQATGFTLDGTSDSYYFGTGFQWSF